MKKLILFVATLGLGAVAYAILRSDQLAPAAGTGRPRVASDDDAPSAADPGRCRATVSSGDRCSRDAEPGSDFCWQHG